MLNKDIIIENLQDEVYDLESKIEELEYEKIDLIELIDQQKNEIEELKNKYDKRTRRATV